MQAPAVRNDPAMKGDQCRAVTGSKAYDFLPTTASDVLCVLYHVFNAVRGNKPAELFMQSFGSLIFAMSAIMVYENFRQKQQRSRILARLAMPCLLAGQIITIGIGSAVYFAFAASADKSAVARKIPARSRIAPEYIWTALISTLVAYEGLIYNLNATGQSYDALAIWHPFPFYMQIINFILPSVIRPFVARASTSLPIFLIGVMSVFLSAKHHFEMLSIGADWKKGFIANWPSRATFGEAIHLFFLLDFLFCFLTIATHVSYSTSKRDGQARFSVTSAIVALAGSALLGPGAGVALVWAYKELSKSSLPVDGKARIA